MLTIFYDGNCPMCSIEMEHLKKFDKDNVIILVDIHQKDFETLYPTVIFGDAMKILHGHYNDKTLLGLEVTHRAWTMVGKGFWVAPLNWPVIKTLSHWVYLGLAKYRHEISAFLAKRFGLKATHCISGTCYDNSTNADHRRK
ncbi:MAG: putative DCC family thiol-disulfide oxidoreductase YuxK [Colwellia sp.]|jgi:predicted DCC family thiol-disulfide oxidoreductase YuxK